MPLSNDFRQLKDNGSASVAELQEFVEQLRGKRPQEVLGLVAQSGLTRAMFAATGLVVGLVALLTVVPYAWSKAFPAQAVSAKPANEPEKPAAAQPQAAPAATAAPAVSAAAPPAAAPAEPSEANKADALSKLGIDETKMADPKRNPLEDKADDLLKDLK